MSDGFVIGMSIACSIFVFMAITTCIVRVRRSKRGRGRVFEAPVVVTSATHTAPGGYPTGMQTVTVYPTAQATGYQQGIYPQQAPYPVSGQLSTMPMPQMQHQMQPNPIGMNQQVMPPYPMAGPAMNPPSYDSAVGASAYEKQSPYNPGYAAAR